jgi:hypothetical protein
MNEKNKNEKDIKKEEEIKKNKNRLILALIFIMIVFLSIISWQRFREFEEAIIKKEIPKIEIPEIKIPEFDLENIAPPSPLQAEQFKENYKIFISSNKTIKIKYPADWQEINKSLLERIDQEMKEHKIEGSEILLLAYQTKLIEHPPFLIIQSLPLKKGLEEITKEIKKIAQEQRAELTIIKKETKNKINYLDLKFKKEGYIFYLKNGIISTKEKNYLITILVLDRFKEKIIPQIDFIFNSIEIIQ